MGVTTGVPLQEQGVDGGYKRLYSLGCVEYSLGYPLCVRFSIRNLGRIQSADLDLRPLTVFMGPNSTNKTWVAYALYGILSGLTTSVPRHPDSSLELPDELNRALEAVVDGWMSALDKNSTDTIQLTVDRSSLPIQEPFPIEIGSEALAPFFGVSAELVAGAHASLSLDTTQIELPSRVTTTIHNGLIDSSDYLDEQGRRLHRTVYAHTGGAPKSDSLRRSLMDSLRTLVLPKNKCTLLFPAERTLIASLAANALGSSRLAKALPDFARFLATASSYAHRGNGPSSSIHLGPEIFSQILGGKVVHDKTESGAELSYLPNDSETEPVRLPLSSTASLIKSLAGLSVYLRSFANPGDVLIIDEPEMNAHPEAIAQLTELFGILVNAGVRVLVTTHSPYLVDQLSNLIEASQLSPSAQEAFSSQLWLKRQDALLKPEDVAVYSFRTDGADVVVESAFDRGDLTINWDTFSNVSNQISKNFDAILDQRHATGS